jgi:hypothetical protein
MTVADLESRMGSAELTEWMAYEEMTGPLGRRRQDIQAATVAAAIANSTRGKRGRKAAIADFLVPYGEQGEKSPEQILQAFEAMGGDERGGRDD